MLLQNEGTEIEKSTKAQETDYLTQEVNGMNLQDVQEKALTIMPLHKVWVLNPDWSTEDSIETTPKDKTSRNACCSQQTEKQFIILAWQFAMN